MEFYLIFFYIISLLIAIIVVVKTILFLSGGGRHKLTSWLYFNKYSIYNSRSQDIVKRKILQNRLSIIILIFFIVDLILLLMSRLA
jgi:hypothetical protein